MWLVQALVSLPVELLHDVPVCRDLGFRLEIVGDLFLAEDSGEDFARSIVILVFARFDYTCVELFCICDGIFENYLGRDLVVCEEVH